MKAIVSLLFIFLFACSNRKDKVIEDAIKLKVQMKGYTIKKYDIMSRQQSNDTLLVRYSAIVTSPLSTDEITDVDFVKFRVIGDNFQNISGYQDYK